MKEYQIYIQDIINSIESINQFMFGITFKQFIKDDKTISAVVRKFEIMGEAAKKIPSEIQEKNSHIPWREICRMRDKLIHHYAEVNLVLLYETIENRLPQLKEDLNKIKI